MSLHSKNFLQKLETLENNEQSIQSVRKWLMVHKKKVAESVKIWYEAILVCPPNRILLYFYLANDVVQTSRKKAPEFTDTWKEYLLKLIPEIHSKIPSADISRLKRVFNIWKDRSIYESNYCDKLIAALDVKNHSTLASSITPASTSSHNIKNNNFPISQKTINISNKFLDSLSKNYSSIDNLSFKSKEEAHIENLYSNFQTAIDENNIDQLQKDLPIIQSLINSLKTESEKINEIIKNIDEEKEILSDKETIINTLLLPKGESLLAHAKEHVNKKRKLEDSDLIVEHPLKKLKEDETVITSSILNAPPPELGDIDDLLGSIAKLQQTI